MSSSFWLQGDDDSDEEIYSSDSESEQEEQPQKQQAASRYTFDSDDEEEAKRVVRSAKEKRFDELQESIKKLRNHMKINDWSKIETEWTVLTKLIEKAKAVIDKEGYPRFVLKAMVDLDDLLKKTIADKDMKKKMNSTNFRSLNTMKQSMKKWVATQKNLETKMEDYRKNPDGEGDDDEAPKPEAKKAAAAPAAAAPAKKAAAKKQMSEESDDDDDEDSFGSGDEESSDSEPEQASGAGKVTGRAKWLKKPGQESSSESESDNDDGWMDSDASDSEDEGKAKKKPTKKGGKDKGKKDTKDKKDDEAEEDEDEKKKREAAEAKAREEEKWDVAKIDKKAKELLQRRGTKNYDRLQQVQLYQFLIDKCAVTAGANTPDRIVRLSFHMIDAQFDANPNMATHMTVSMWKTCYNTFVRILNILKTEKQIHIVDYEPEEEPVVLNADGTPAPYDPTKHVNIRGPLLSQLERLNDEFIKSLQFMDPHTQDYITRLRDELAFLKLARAVQDYFVENKMMDKATFVAARRLDHLYYKRERDAEEKKTVVEEKKSLTESQDVAAVAAVAAAVAEKKENEEKKAPEESLNVPEVADDVPLQDVVNSICSLLYKFGDDKLKRKAMLQQIYSFALHDKFFEARDLMLVSHLQDSIQLADPTTQVLYNRALVQLGLAAFRRGRIIDAHNYLQEIVSLGRTKELLAQGMSSRFNSEKTPEQEKLERRRQVPYPMHINLDVLEGASLISAMLLEVPSMALNHHDPRRRVISKNLRKIMDGLERQVFAGPPETTREHVVAASKALSRGEWQQCYDLLMSLEMWKLIPKADTVKAMLRRKVQEEGLRTYLFAFAQHYDSIKLAELSVMFDLPESSVHSLISRMIISEELKASFDQPNNSLVMHRAEPTRLQYLTLQFADKAAILVESGENVEGQQGRQGRGGDRQWQDQHDGRRQYGHGQGRFNQGQRNQQYGGSRNRRTEGYANRAAGNVRTRFAQNQRY